MLDAMKHLFRNFLWSRHRQNAAPPGRPMQIYPPASRPLGASSPYSQSGGRPGSIREMRERIIAGEHASEVQNASQKTIRLLRAGTENPTTATKKCFAEDGLASVETDYLFETAEGRLIKGEELHGGGACSQPGCRGWTAQLYFCPLCRRGYCETHAVPWRDVRVCPEHFRFLRFHEDTWENG